MSEKMDTEKGDSEVWVNLDEVQENNDLEGELEEKGEEEKDEKERQDEKEEEGDKDKTGKEKEIDDEIRVRPSAMRKTSGNGEFVPMREVDSKLIWRRFSMEVFSGLYTILIVSFAIVLPITIFLSGGNFRTKGVHVTIFHMYLYILGTAFCIYLTVLVRKYKKTTVTSNNYTTSDDVNSDAGSDISSKRTYVINDNVHAIRPEGDDAKETGSDVIEEGETPGGRNENYVPAIYKVDDGVNFFLRLGLIAFGLGGVLLDGIRIVEYSRVYVLWECYGSAHLASVIIKLIFILVQTFTLFKYHAIGFNVHQPLVKLGLLHTAATNLAMWMNIVVTEAVEAYNHNIHYEQSLLSTTPGPTIQANVTNATASDEDELNAALCISYSDTLSAIASPFLFPFIIEYSLLAAAVLYKMNSFVGPERYHVGLHKEKETQNDKDSHPELYKTQENASECSKANSGLFVGLAIFTVAVCGVSFYLYFSMQEDMEHEMAMIYLISDIVLKVLLFVTIIFAYWRTMKLYFYGISDSSLDQNILIFALFGTYLLNGFVGVAAGYQVDSPDESTMQTSQMIISGVVFDFIQVTLLVAFIVDGLHRRSVTPDHMTQKPGRSLVTFLLILNLAMWLVNTFEMKLVHQSHIFYNFYGHLAWTIIIGLTAPIAIYFRFHCAVCLSVIWTDAYTKVPMVQVDEIHLEKCGKIL